MLTRLKLRIQKNISRTKLSIPTPLNKHTQNGQLSHSHHRRSEKLPKSSSTPASKSPSNAITPSHNFPNPPAERPPLRPMTDPAFTPSPA